VQTPLVFLKKKELGIYQRAADGQLPVTALVQALQINHGQLVKEASGLTTAECIKPIT
jgi:hypothetical protein